LKQWKVYFASWSETRLVKKHISITLFSTRKVNLNMNTIEERERERERVKLEWNKVGKDAKRKGTESSCFESINREPTYGEPKSTFFLLWARFPCFYFYLLLWPISPLLTFDLYQAFDAHFYTINIFMTSALW